MRSPSPSTGIVFLRASPQHEKPVCACNLLLSTRSRRHIFHLNKREPQSVSPLPQLSFGNNQKIRPLLQICLSMNRKRSRDGQESKARKQDSAISQEQGESDATSPMASSSHQWPDPHQSANLTSAMLPSAQQQQQNAFAYHASMSSLPYPQHNMMELQQASANAAAIAAAASARSPIRKTSLAESLPVAASFHPAELFGPATPPVASRRIEETNDMVQQMLSTATRPISTSESLLLRAAMQDPASALSSLQQQQSQQLSSLAMSRFGGQSWPLAVPSFDVSGVASSSEGQHSRLPHLQRSFFAAGGGQSGFGSSNESNASRLEDQSSSRIIASIDRGETGWHGGGEIADAMSRDSALASRAASNRSQAPSLASRTDSLVAVRPSVELESGTGDKAKIFPSILHRLLMDLESMEGGREIACFTVPHGKSFIVKNLKRFESEVMPNYFPRMNRFASFQRQLNLYNFARISGNGPDRGAYCHQLFDRDHPALARTMRRTKIKGLFTVPEEKRRKRNTKEPYPEPPP